MIEYIDAYRIERYILLSASGSNPSGAYGAALRAAFRRTDAAINNLFKRP